MTALDRQAPSLYRLLSEAGRRVCVLNVPMTYPPTPVNGFLVSGLPAPSTNVPITYPRELYEEILRDVGDYILYPDPGQAYSDSGVDAFLDRLHRAADLRAATFDYLRDRLDWDFAMAVFNGTDTVGHAMWRYMDPNHPGTKFKQARYGDAIRSTTVAWMTTWASHGGPGFRYHPHPQRKPPDGPLHKFIHINNWLGIGPMHAPHLLGTGQGGAVPARLHPHERL